MRRPPLPGGDAVRHAAGSFLLILAVLATLLVVWKAYIAVFDVSRFLLPPPEDVWSASVDLVRSERTWHHVRVTLQEIVGGFALAAVAGVLTGTLLGEVRLVERAMNPFLVALQVMPKVALIPLLLLWFGFGIASKVIVAAIFAYFPIATATVAGIKSVDAAHRDLAATLLAGRRHRLWLIELPSALPSILTGMEVGIVLATVGAVVAEYLGGSEGLGWLALISLNYLRVDQLFGVIVLLSLLGFALHTTVVSLRRVLVPWHASASVARLPRW